MRLLTILALLSLAVNAQEIKVDGYNRADGTYVRPHYKTYNNITGYNTWERGDNNPTFHEPGYVNSSGGSVVNIPNTHWKPFWSGDIWEIKSGYQVIKLTNLGFTNQRPQTVFLFETFNKEVQWVYIIIDEHKYVKSRLVPHGQNGTWRKLEASYELLKYLSEGTETISFLFEDDTFFILPIKGLNDGAKYFIEEIDKHRIEYRKKQNKLTKLKQLIKDE